MERITTRLYLMGLIAVTYNEADSGHWFGIVSVWGVRVATFWDTSLGGFVLKLNQWRVSIGGKVGWGLDLGQDLGGRYKRLDMGRISLIYRRAGGASL